MPQRRTKQSGSAPAEGQRIRVMANTNSHDYTIGKTYVVTADRNEGHAFRARDEETGEIGNWLCPDDVVIVPRIGWDWLQTVLPAEDVAILAAFDGVSALALKLEVKDAILADLDTLERSILSAVSKRPASQGGKRGSR